MMKTFIRVLSIAVLTLVGFLSHADEVLYWMVDNPTITTGLGESYKAAMAGSHGPRIEITDARIAAFKTTDAAAYQQNRTGGAGGEDFSGTVVYLDLYYKDYEYDPPRWVVDPTAEPRLDSAWIENGVMAGDDSGAAYTMASLGTLGDVDFSQYSFAIELGAWSSNTDDAKWLLAGVSAIATYDQLAAFRNVEIGVQSQMAWNPGAYAAPEPTSGLLLLIGGALLALKRKRV